MKTSLNIENLLQDFPFPDLSIERLIQKQLGRTTNKSAIAVVTGGAGFIGTHLVHRLHKEGYFTIVIDRKRGPEYPIEPGDIDWYIQADLTFEKDAIAAFEEVISAHRNMGTNLPIYVWMLAADMGGMGFISQDEASILLNNTRISFNTISAIQNLFVPAAIFYASSACVYPEGKQTADQDIQLREIDAYPADPDTLYGWEKLSTEKLLIAMYEEHGWNVRIARFHNVYGPYGTYTGGREKAPAAFCRKIAEAKLEGQRTIEVWGDGEQRRSFLYIDDCIDGILGLTFSHKPGYAMHLPVNLGSEEAVTINQLAKEVSRVAGYKVNLYHIDGPQGVRFRNSDTSVLKELLSWKQNVSLEAGLRTTYEWVYQQVLVDRLIE